MIKENSIITLGKKYKYLVCYSVMINDINYILVSNVDNPLDTCFYEYLGGKNLNLIKDEKIINKLLEMYKHDKIDI